MEKKVMMAEIFAARQEMGLEELKDLGKRSTERLEKLHTKTMAEFEEFTKQREREEMAKKEAKKEEKKTAKRTGPVEKPAKAQKPAPMDDRMAFEAMAVLLWKEEDRPDVAGMTDDQVREELKESVSLLAPEDEAQLATGASASGDPIPHADRAPEVWAFFCGLRKDLAAKEVKVKSEKVAKVKEPKVTGKSSTRGKDVDRDEFGFMTNSNGHKFVEFLKTGPKTMRECQDAPWNPTRATFNSPLKKLIADKKAVRNKDGKIELIV